MTTQYANASYQEIIDLHTESDKVSVVGIHTPCSDTPYHMLRGFWEQFKKFRYNGCSLSLVPSATLPVDPLEVSYDASEPTIDPRDTLNPILFHGCHGDDMGAILNALYSEPVSGTGQLIGSKITDSTEHALFAENYNQIPITEIFETLYYNALTDKTWLKAHPQRGFRKNGLHPLIYQVASTVQIGNLEASGLYPRGITHNDDTGEGTDDAVGMFGFNQSGGVYGETGFGRPVFGSEGGSTFSWTNPAVRSVQGFLTPRLQRLGWMDTRQVVGVGPNASVVEEMTSTSSLGDKLADMYLESAKMLKPVLTPKIFMGMIMLPPAYKTMQHFRLVLNHSFSFAKFRGASMQYNTKGQILKPYGYFNYSGLDDSKRDVDPTPEKEGDDDTKSEQ